MIKPKLLFRSFLPLAVALVFGGYGTLQGVEAAPQGSLGYTIIGQEWNGYWFGPGWQLNKCDPGFPLPPGIIVEKDVRVKMRDGVELSCNVYRPAKAGRFPVITSFTTYHKDVSGWAEGRSIRTDQVSRECSFEAPDPAFWVPNDYVFVIFDQRGTGLSQGERLRARRGEDFYDGIEWAAAQPWSDGNVGMSGVSALGSSQWYAAAAQPPHLRCIVPWEAQQDPVGGPGTKFWGITEFLFGRGNSSYQAPLNPNLGQSIPKVTPPSPLVIENVNVPTLACATWSDQELHTYHTLWNFEHISSEHKWLYTHGGLKWQRYSGEDSRLYQKMFFDCFLKGDCGKMMNTPQVRLEVRDTIDKYAVRYENEWPIARTEYKKLYLDANTGTMSFDSVKEEGKLTYESADGAGVFSIKFDEDTELTGYMTMNLWVSPDEANDMDLMVKLRKLDVGGNVVYFAAWHALTTYEVASGWWRLSWRELDMKKSRPFQPIPTFGAPQKVKPGEIVEARFSVYPSSTLFHKGETLQVFVAGSNQYGVSNARFAYEFQNMGKHSIYTGGKYDSYLLVPVLPKLPAKR